MFKKLLCMVTIVVGIMFTNEVTVQAEEAVETTVESSEEVIAEEAEETEEAEEPAPEAEEETPAPAEEAQAPAQAEAPAPAQNCPIALPAEVHTYCEQAAAEFGIDSNILKALVYTESKGNAAAKNRCYIGLTQLNPSNFGAAIATLGADPNDAYQNVRICAYMLSGWMAKYGNMYIALDCWHQGERSAAAANRADGTNYSRTICSNAQLLAAA